VADYRPDEVAQRKLKRGDVGASLTIALTANPDIAHETRALRKSGSLVVGFALETDDLLANAQRKLEAKGFDLLVANDATEEGSGFESDTNRVVILSPEGEAEELPLQTKDEVAEAILDRVGRCMEPA
jgi:phosphopantothenoylcysteine decarboxylase/phosphopantothenate--cysteine ligase